MKIEPKLIHVKFLKRYKRFFADVILNKKKVTTHCPNSGSMLGILDENNDAWISKSDNPNRKLKYTLEIINDKKSNVGVNTHRANRIVEEALKNKKRICAVGTTVMRGLESSVSSMQTLNTYRGWTHKFIFPPYEFSIANAMITNFHTPKSTLLMMVSAFADADFIKQAYEEAVKEKYNFYSYGDAMLIL